MGRAHRQTDTDVSWQESKNFKGQGVDWIKLSKAYKALGVSRKTMMGYIAKDLVTAKQLPSGHWRVLKESVDTFFDNSIDRQAEKILAACRRHQPAG